MAKTKSVFILKTMHSMKTMRKRCTTMKVGDWLKFAFNTHGPHKVPLYALSRAINLERRARKKKGVVVLTDRGTHIHASCAQTEKQTTSQSNKGRHDKRPNQL